MKPGDIFFSMTHGAFDSESIAWFMRSRWSHCGIIRETTANTIYTTETNSFCVCHGRMDSYDKDSRVEYEVWSPRGISDNERQKIGMAADEYCGKLYGYLQFPSLAIKTLLERINISIKNPVSQGKMCDDVVMRAYRDGPIPSLRSLDESNTYLEQLYQLVVQCGNFDRVAVKEWKK